MGVQPDDGRVQALFLQAGQHAQAGHAVANLHARLVQVAHALGQRLVEHAEPRLGGSLRQRRLDDLGGRQAGGVAGPRADEVGNEEHCLKPYLGVRP